MSDFRTIDDVWRAVRAVCELCNTDTVVIIGSQAALFRWRDAPERIRYTLEIDVYPQNIEAWLSTPELRDCEASEVIAANLGEGSLFHETHGYYVDGVDEDTAVMADCWRIRADTRQHEQAGKIYKAIVPSLNDIAVAKLVRGDPKDREFFKDCLAAGKVDPHEMLRLIDLLKVETDTAYTMRTIVRSAINV